MNFNRVSWIGLISVALIASSVSVQAKTTASGIIENQAASAENSLQGRSQNLNLSPQADETTAADFPDLSYSAADLLAHAIQDGSTWQTDKSAVKAPAADSLSSPSSGANASLNLAQNSAGQEVAQAIERGRGGVARFYIGAGGNIGFGEENTSLGQGSFAVISKFGIIPEVAVRPSVLIGDDNATFLVPVTYNFLPPDDDIEGLTLAPYLGAGIGLTTDEDSDLAFLVTGGLDIPITSRITGNAALNVGFFNQTDIGLTLGVGYNF